MKKTIMAIAATLVMTSAALAADLPSRKTAPAVVPLPPPIWTGFYVGANVGGGFTDSNSSAGVIGGVQLGYTYQISPMFVVGAETDFQGTSIGGGNSSNWYYSALAMANGIAAANNPGASINYFGTVRGRVGVVPLMPNLMLYGTGGFAYGEVARNGVWNKNTAMQTGWTAGGGAEYALTPNWSTKVEYLYTDLSGNNQNAWLNTGASLNNVNNNTRFHTIRAGVNYRFNSDLPTLANF